MECGYGKGDTPLAPSPYGGCVAILCGGLPPHLCRHIYAMAIIVDQQTPLLKILRTGLQCHTFIIIRLKKSALSLKKVNYCLFFIKTGVKDEQILTCGHQKGN